MVRQLNLLMVEDSESDAELLLRELRRGGYDVRYERVDTAPAMSSALARRSWDLVISDCSMPTFTSLGALAVLRETGSDVPVIVVSGTMDEDEAVEVLRAGASDFMSKSRMGRLLPAIARELREKTLRDEGRQSQQRIKVSEDRFRNLLEAASDAMVIVGSSGAIAFVNARTEELFGYSREELVGRPIELLVPAGSRGDLSERRRRFFASADTQPERVTVELIALRRDRTEFPAEIGLNPSRTAEGNVVTASIRDVTERHRAQEALRRTEEQLRQAQKMEAVGTLAGGMAHDFNNVLSVILSYAGFLADSLTADDPRRADVTEIRKATDRAVQLTRRLLLFARKQPRAPMRVVNLNEVVQGIERMVSQAAGEQVKVAMVPGHALWMVKADPIQIEQVILNLTVNARDAMTAGGRLTIETANVRVPADPGPDVPSLPPGDYVGLRVTDTGVGMDSSTRTRIFEPFFSTKEPGRGTGLGLSVVYGIVAQCGGTIVVDSQPGAGATFRIFLPATQETPNLSMLPPPSAALGGSETLLVVEDDDQVRKVFATVLRRNGYTVIDTQNAGEALLASERGSPIHLLLTDVMLPWMSGQNLAARLRALRPEMKVLYMSGHAAGLPAETESDLLEKPISPDALLARIREVLDRPPASPAT